MAPGHGSGTPADGSGTGIRAGAGPYHMPDRTVIEVEVEGEREICIGIHQAIKYRSLAAADAGYPLLTSRVRSLVAAYSTEYSKARELADRYDIPLVSVSREKVLNGAR